MCTEPTLYLIRLPRCSQGDVTLDTLEFVFKDGKPALHWGVSWQGTFGCSTGSEGYDLIPTELLPTLTAASLTDWMLRSMNRMTLSLADFPAFAHDERLIAWCDQVRERYRSADADRSR